MPGADDVDLLARLRSGDGAAFDAVYAAHKDALFRFLVRLCGRRDLAEDLFQETWMRLARHAPTLRDDSSVRAWLYAVARNLCRSQARWSVVDARTLEGLARWWYLEGVAGGEQEERLAAGAALGRVEAAFRRLPLPHREVLLLAMAEDLPQDEIGRVLGITHEAVRQRLARARAALARHLGPEETPWKTNATISSKA